MIWLILSVCLWQRFIISFPKLSTLSLPTPSLFFFPVCRILWSVWGVRRSILGLVANIRLFLVRHVTQLVKSSWRVLLIFKIGQLAWACNDMMVYALHMLWPQHINPDTRYYFQGIAHTAIHTAMIQELFLCKYLSSCFLGYRQEHVRWRKNKK